MKKPEENIRIVDIARIAGVSVGTVDRVIHNRGRVSEKNKKKVETALKEVNYKPNLIARSLASKKRFNIAAIIPSFTSGQYWEAVSNGIDCADSEVKQYNIQITKFFFDQYDYTSFDEIANEILNYGFDAVLIATLFSKSVIKLCKKLDLEKIPYVFLDSNIESEKQLAYFGTNSYDGGKIAAKLLSEKISSTSDILIAKIIHNGANDPHQGVNRKNGFYDHLKGTDFKGEIHEVELKTNDTNYNASTLNYIFEQFPNIEGCIMFNSTCYIIGEYLKQRKLSHIKLIGYDLIEKNTQLLSEGIITALIAQRPESQGYNSIKSLFNYLISGEKPKKINLMPIDILIKENIEYYLNYNL